MARRNRLSRILIAFITKLLVKEHHGYVQRFAYDPRTLRDALKPGDVILVEGSQRISEVIKYLTQSSWSHAALYVGDALVRDGDEQARELRERFGEEAESLLVEATVEEGVSVAPLSKYARHNIRICRPINLRARDLDTVLKTVIGQIGGSYNVDHVLDLMRYLFPVHLIPRRWRRTALEHGGRYSREVICSAQIAMAFQEVRYPILPVIDGRETSIEASDTWLHRFLSRRRRAALGNHVFRPCDPMLITPRDFDLSPYFEIVKLPVYAKREFDYKRIVWADAGAEVAASESDPGKSERAA